MSKINIIGLLITMVNKPWLEIVDVELSIAEEEEMGRFMRKEMSSTHGLDTGGLLKMREELK